MVAKRKRHQHGDMQHDGYDFNRLGNAMPVTAIAGNNLQLPGQVFDCAAEPDPTLSQW